MRAVTPIQPIFCLILLRLLMFNQVCGGGEGAAGLFYCMGYSCHSAL